MTETQRAPRGFEMSSTCQAIDAESIPLGRAFALAETGANVVALMLAVQARAKFGGDGVVAKPVLEGLAAARDLAGLLGLGETLVAAKTWDDWLAGAVVPPPAEGFPQFEKDDEIEFGEEKPSIEFISQAETFGKKKIIVVMRFQKWYQPDIGSDLYKLAKRLERQYGASVVCGILLMWPSADGPAVTGVHKVWSPGGKRIDFRYTVRRAWELSPEEALAAPALMVLLPLTQGFKSRMPELIAAMREKMAPFQAEKPVSADQIWFCFYLCLGTICTLDEARSLLGEQFSKIHASADCKKAHGQAFMKGYREALAEGPVLALRDLVARQTRTKVGDESDAAALAAGASAETLEAAARRMFVAANDSELSGG